MHYIVTATILLLSGILVPILLTRLDAVNVMQNIGKQFLAFKFGKIPSFSLDHCISKEARGKISVMERVGTIARANSLKEIFPQTEF